MDRAVWVLSLSRFEVFLGMRLGVGEELLEALELTAG
jgi:hypothetical protein